MTKHLLAAAALFLPPVALAAQDPPPTPLPPAIPPQENILFLEDTPETTVFDLTTRVRHTTIITLPPHENILDFVVGDQDYWHLTGAANVAFLKPIAADAATNIALVCASGRIYSFLVRESAADEPHLVVRIGAAPGTPADPADAAFPAGGHEPAFVARDRVRGYEVLAEQAQLEIAQVRAEAIQDVDAFREDYPTRLRFAYSLPRQAHEWPWRIEGNVARRQLHLRALDRPGDPCHLRGKGRRALPRPLRPAGRRALRHPPPDRRRLVPAWSRAPPLALHPSGGLIPCPPSRTTPRRPPAPFPRGSSTRLWSPSSPSSSSRSS